MSKDVLLDHVELLFESDEGSWTVAQATLHERVDFPYELRLVLVTEDEAAQPEPLLGKRARLTMIRAGEARHVPGVVAAVEAQSNRLDEHVASRVIVRPAFVGLRHRVDTRIFQGKTVPEILEEVLGEGLGHYKASADLRLVRSYRPCDYRVQYAESDFDFCTRLMQEEGIAYYFDLDGDVETMVLSDAQAGFPAIEHGFGTIPFSRDHGTSRSLIYDFKVRSQLRPTKLASRHFHWKTPSVPFEGASSDAAAGDLPDGSLLGPDREIYHHDRLPLTTEPGGTTYGADGADQVQVRRQLDRVGARVARGAGSLLAMRSGATFELSHHPVADLDGEYVVLSVDHELTQGGRNYRNRFECIPKSVVHRPARSAKKPRVAIQTATVVGPAGEEIHTDEHGRIKVQMHWDRQGANDEHSSAWIRVQQPWGGAGWGFVFIPRIGMEVVVDFVNGDPDQPVVLGCVYNAEHLLPYPLPDEKTKSTIKTESSLGGGGNNELRFEDKAGSEEIYIHAQKDFDEIVENDHTTTVHNDQHIRVDNDQQQEVGNDQTEHVFANQDLTVDANRTITVHGNFTETVDGSETRLVSSGVTETIDAGETRTITGGMTESISGGRTQTINGGSTETITASLAQTITGGATITTPGALTLTALGGLTITAAGGTKIMTNSYTLIAPAGNTHHDSYWKFLAREWYDNFAMKLDVKAVSDDAAGVSMSLNEAFFLESKAISSDTAGLRNVTWTINGDSAGEKAFAEAVEVELKNMQVA